MVLANGFDDIPGMLVIIFLFGGGVITSVVALIARNWRQARESEHLAALKQAMIERGMSAEDIERVVRAAPEAAPAGDSKAHDKTLLVRRLTEKLTEQEVPAGPLEEILGAFAAADLGKQEMLVDVVENLFDGGADVERVLVVVRALCRPAPSPDAAAKDQRFTDEPGMVRR
jgi:hypothetical protein